METILMIKRLPIPEKEFKGDRTWQIAPYEIKDEVHAERLLVWLKGSVFKDMPIIHKIKRV